MSHSTASTAGVPRQRRTVTTDLAGNIVGTNLSRHLELAEVAHLRVRARRLVIDVIGVDGLLTLQAGACRHELTGIELSQLHVLVGQFTDVPQTETHLGTIAVDVAYYRDRKRGCVLDHVRAVPSRDRLSLSPELCRLLLQALEDRS